MNMMVTTTEPLTMSSLEIAELVEKRHDSVKRTIDALENRGVVTFTQSVEPTPGGGKERTIYNVDKRNSYVVVAQLSPEFTARLVDRWQELEQRSQKGLIVPNFSNPAEAARAWALQYEQAQEAMRTKAEIGNRREATAMNTASQAVKKVSRLETQLDTSMQYITIKRMSMLYHGQQFNWRLLKSTSIDMELPPVDVFDANYGSVKAYHADVWREVYAITAEPTA